jgi:hypothetical protein
MYPRETAGSLAIVPTSFVLVVVGVTFVFLSVNFNFYPVFYEVRVGIAVLSHIPHLVNVLEENQILPFFVFTEIL